MIEAPCRLTVREIRQALERGEVSAVEITRAFLDRIEEVEERVGAFIEVWPEEALARASAIDAMRARGEDPGPLGGVPVAVKDNFCTRTGHTTCGSRILRGFRSPYNATVIEKLLDAGAVLFGKLNMDEFAMGSSTENSSLRPTRNPWDLSRVPGGSSGGAAAAVVADELAFALGSDTGGSVRQPAALSGCVGMKPTYGRVSRYGLVAYASSLDQIGPLTKDVSDLAVVMNVIAGHDPRDATSANLAVPDYRESLRADVSDIRLGLPRECFTDALDAEIREKIERAVEVLEGQGVRVVEVSLPHTKYSIAAYYIICTAEASANLARFDGVRYGFRHPEARTVQDVYVLSKSEGFGPEVKLRIMLGTYALSSGYYDAYYLKAQKVRSLIRRDFNEAFTKCDVIVTPTSPTAAFKIGEKTDDPLQMYLSDIYTTSVNLAGIPGVSVPCGLTGSRLPVGMQLLGKPFDEETLIRVAYTHEQCSGIEPGAPPIV